MVSMGCEMRLPKVLTIFGLWFAVAFLLVGGGMAAGHQKELHIIQDWRGDYPVSGLYRLPDGQQSKGMGYLSNVLQFTKFWQMFKGGEKVPDIDFKDQIVVFSRNVTFYNRIGILKVLLRDGVAEILTMETRSAFPIEDKVGMAIAVIPRAGVKYIKSGDERTPVTEDAHGSASDPLNTTYTIEGEEITLKNGRSEVAIEPNSATKIRTFVIGKEVDGDLDGDGDEETALFLVHDPGGSGTFYYVAVALNLDGQYLGTNAVLLGDRVAPKGLQIRNGVVIAGYAKRGPHEPMSTAPSVEESTYLALDKGNLAALKPLGPDEQILEGRVIIGHEVRSFHPCTQRADYWLSGDSPALGEIMARYREALPDARPYTPLFMVLTGKFVERPCEGFGADYEAAFLATQLVGVRSEGNCSDNSEYVQ